MLSDLNTILANEELIVLNDFLTALHENTSQMDLSKVHGFLTAVVSAPSMLMPSQWQQIILDGAREFEHMDEARTIIGLIMRLYNQICHNLQDSDSFELLLWENNQLMNIYNSNDSTICSWCTGYLLGSQLDRSWQSDKKASKQLLPFAILAKQVNLQENSNMDIDSSEDAENFYQKCRTDLHKFVKSIYDHFAKLRRTMAADFNKQSSRTYLRETPKIGRNDPCYCGSGKKFKKCCWTAAHETH